MFKKRQKKSHKNDEVYVDYSKDIDVKKQDEDQAKPEHYKALEVEDEIVVSTMQIKEAKQQQLQDDFIKQREERLAEEQAKNKEENLHEQNIKQTLDEESSSNLRLPEEDINDELEDVLEKDDSTIEEQAPTDTEDEPYHQQSNNIDEEKLEHYQENEKPINSETKNTIYPSFLRDEFENRGKPLTQVEPVVDQEKPDEVIREEEKDLYKEDQHVLPDEEDELYEEQDEDISIEKKQDLHSYFQVDSSVLKTGVKSAQYKSRPTKEKKDALYRYKHHSFYSMDEFVLFLEKNTIHIEHIAHDILNDELFFRWLKEESKFFEESIIKMKKFKQDLKQ